MIALGILLFSGFVLVLTPETGKDALIYHLAVPKLYLFHQGFYFIPGNVFATYPLLSEMHYILALFLQNDILAKAMNFAVLCGVLLGMGLFTRHVFREHAFATVSMLIFCSIPTVFTVAHAAYNDLFVAFFTLAAVYAFFRWSDQKLIAWLILCGFFSGAAAACKYTALLLTPLGCLGILWSAEKDKTKAPRAAGFLMLYAAAAFITGIPFYFRNWIMTGNPVHPFLYGIFGGLGWDADQARLYDIFIQHLGTGRDLVDYLLLPLNVSLRAKMDSPEFDGILGPIFLLTLPFLLAERRWERPVLVILVYVLLTFLFWASSAQQMRYLVPLFPLLALVTGAIMTRLRDRRRIFVPLVCIILGCLTFNVYHIIRDFTKIGPFRVVAGIESREDFLARTLAPYTMYRYVNRSLPQDAKVFLLYMKNFTFLCERDCFADSMFEAHTLQKILRGESSPYGVRSRLRAMGFTHLLYDNHYLLGDPSPLSADERLLFMDFRERCLTMIHGEGTYRLDLIS